MSFDWREYLNLSRFLGRQTGNGFAQEAALRSAVSRAYYAAFCHARNYARDRHGFRPRDRAEDHSGVREHFRRRGKATISEELDSLRQLRNVCDYRDVVPNIANLVNAAMLRAQQVIDSLN